MSKIIAVTRDASKVAEVLGKLPADCQVVQEKSMASALSHLMDEGVLGIIADRESIPQIRPTPDTIDTAQLLAAITESIVVIDRSLRVIWINRQFEDWGWKFENVVGANCFQLFHNRTRPCPHCEGTEVFSTGCKVVRVKQGVDARYYETTTSPVFDEMGGVVQAIMVTRDVTDEKRLEEQIESIYKAGREITGLDPQAMSRMAPADRAKLIRDNIARYIRRVLGSENFVIRQLDERTNELKPIIIDGAKRAVVHKAVPVAGPDACVTGRVADTGESRLVSDSVNEPLFVDEIGGARSSITVPLRLGERTIGTINVQSRTPDAFSAEDLKFLEIFADYVAIALNTADLLDVEDQPAFGKVAAKLAHEIENPLNAIDAAVKGLRDEYIGHDTGASSRFREVEIQMTRIREAIRKVTTFTEAPPGEVVPLEGDEGLEGRKILVADDDAEILETITEILTRLGSKVDTVRDGREAVEMAASRTYDVVISDIRMPKKSGYEVFSEIKARAPGTAVMLMTAFGYDPDHSIVQARQDGLEVVLFKPFKVGVLKKEILRALKGPGAPKA